MENMEIDEDNYSSEDDDEVNELIREIFGDEESLEEEQEEEEEYEDGNEMWNETRYTVLEKTMKMNTLF